MCRVQLTARSNFTHTIRIERETAHRLITHGIYRCVPAGRAGAEKGERGPAASGLQGRDAHSLLARSVRLATPSASLLWHCLQLASSMHWPREPLVPHCR